MVNSENEKTYVDRNFDTKEMVWALIWLSLGAIVSALLEVVYLGTWISLPGGHSVAFPYPIIIAFLFNMVLTKTVMLWTRKKPQVLIPLCVWVTSVVALGFSGLSGGDVILLNSGRSLLLLFAGLAGGVLPLLRAKVA